MGNFSDSNFEIWTSNATCPSSACNLRVSGSLYDSSSSIIYNNINYDDTILFFGLNSTDGSLSTSMYTTGSSTLCLTAGSISKFGTSLFLFFECSQAHLFVYNISSSTFTESYSYTQTNLTLYDAYMTSSYTYLCGKSSSGNDQAFYVRGPTSNLDEINGINTTIVSMSVISSSGNYYISSSSVTSMSSSSYGVTPGITLTTASVTVNSNTTSYSDAAFYETDITISSVTSGTNHSESLFITCSRSGNTTFSYSITYANNSAGPSWITVADVNQAIDIVAPSVTVSTSYSFLLVANTTTESSSRNIYLTVEPSNTTSSNTTSNTTTSSDDASAKTTADIMTGVALGAAAASAITVATISGGSLMTMWVMLGQFQYYMLLPLLGAHIPLKFIDFLTEYKFVLFSFSFFDMPNFIINFKLYSYYIEFFE